MSQQLRKIGGVNLKTNRTKRPPTRDILSIISQIQQVQQAQVVQNIPEYAILQSIPGIEPFLIKELIPDLIYMLQQAGINIIADTLAPEAKQRMLQVFNILNLPAVASEFSSENPLIFIEQVYQLGKPVLEQIVSQANPQDPISIIFIHPSQDANRQTQKIELEILTNEPKIIERDDVQCFCGSRRIRTVTAQTRRADEPQTVFANCVSCKRKWSFSAA